MSARILIADDSEYNRVLMKAYLKNLEFELDCAENGRIALEKSTSGAFSLVLMDLQMPEMDGLEATRAIRLWEAQTGTRPIPILALTAHSAGEVEETSLQAGCNEHLTKPIRKSILLEAISRHLHAKIPVTPPRGFGDLIPGYLADVQENMHQILTSVGLEDFDIARRLGHDFKGTGESFGFPEITRTGAAIELAATTSSGEEIRRQVMALADFLERVEIVA